MKTLTFPFSGENVMTLTLVCNQFPRWVTKCHPQNERKLNELQRWIHDNRGLKHEVNANECKHIHT